MLSHQQSFLYRVSFLSNAKLISFKLSKVQFVVHILIICNVKVNVSPLKSYSLLSSSFKQNVTVIKTDLVFCSVLSQAHKKFYIQEVCLEQNYKVLVVLSRLLWNRQQHYILNNFNPAYLNLNYFH